MRKINITEDYQLSKVQDNAVAAFDELKTIYQVLNGVFVTSSISTSDTPVNHTLKRNIVGWIVVRKNAAGDVWESATSNPRPADQIIFRSSSAVNVTLYIF